MKLEILQVPDCPNVAVLEDRIRQALGAEQATVEIAHRVVADQEQATATGMTGSPTLLLDGHDPFAVTGLVPSLSCRLYPSTDGAPTVSALRAAFGLADTSDSGGCTDATSCCPPSTQYTSAAEALSSWRGDARPADPVERAVYQAILRGFADRGRPPTSVELSEALAGHDVSAAVVLARLHDGDVIRLDGAGGIASAYPFSATPTGHRVQISGGPTVHAMCAVDALGVAAMLDTDTEITSTDPVTHAPIIVTTRDQRLTATPATAVVFVGAQATQGPSADTCCNYLNFFADRPGAETWAAGNLAIPGQILDLDQAHALGNRIFANLLRDIP
ncbi:alkylmercury lyase family protein [Nocardia cyriacigeorgica]|nr:alkylmercury lyase family protein [Nocardia cyriacigeorgica]MBF6439609.1 alkylmercury lyase family protein [Nocardia cyriacigeorgica]